MGSISTTPTSVVCDDRPALRRTVTSLLARCGFSVVGDLDHFDDLRTLVLTGSPTVAILTLPVSGLSGLDAVTALRAAVPQTEIVLLCAFGNLELPARDAGAYALVSEDDPQALQAVLLEICRRWHASHPTVARPPTYEEPTLDRAAPSAVA